MLMGDPRTEESQCVWLSATVFSYSLLEQLVKDLIPMPLLDREALLVMFWVLWKVLCNCVTVQTGAIESRSNFLYASTLLPPGTSAYCILYLAWGFERV